MKVTGRALCMLVVTMMLPSLSYGQDVPVAKEGGGNGVEFIQLAHMGAQRMANVISGLGFRVVVVAAPDGKILLRGQKAEVARAVEVIGKLDTPGDAGAAGVRAEFIPLGNIATINLKSAVESLVTGSQSRFAIDHQNHMLVVRAREDEITSVRNFLARIDKPLGSVTVELFFLRAMIGSTGGDHDRDLPSALVPIAKTLAANGFAHVTLMAPIRLTCRMERDFGSKSRLRTNPASDSTLGDDLEFTVRGGVRPTTAPETVELTVDARIEGSFIDSDLMEVGDISFRVEATIAAKFGQYVILAAAPSSTANGEAVAVVVRVTSDSAQ